MMKCGFYSVAIHSSFSASSRRPTQRQAVMFSLPWDSGAIWSNGVSDRMLEISKLSIETNTIMKNVGPISPGILYVCRNIYIYIYIYNGIRGQRLQEPLGGSSIQSKFLDDPDKSQFADRRPTWGGYPKPSLCKTPSSKKAKPNVHIFGPSCPLVNQL